MRTLHHANVSLFAPLFIDRGPDIVYFGHAQEVRYTSSRSSPSDPIEGVDVISSVVMRLSCGLTPPSGVRSSHASRGSDFNYAGFLDWLSTDCR